MQNQFKQPTSPISVTSSTLPALRPGEVEERSDLVYTDGRSSDCTYYMGNQEEFMNSDGHIDMEKKRKKSVIRKATSQERAGKSNTG